MKKYFFLTVAVLAALASCAKVDVTGTQDDKPISFRVARYSQTKANDDYKTDYKDVPFGAYSWYKGVSASDNTTFMTNEKVTYNATGNEWLPSTTYYWPKSGSLDFICYSPYSADTQTFSIGEDRIAISGYTVGTDDLMYGDKAVGLTDNRDTYNYNGVPVLFHHALAQVSFAVKAAYLQKTADTGDVTKWEITVNSVGLEGVRTTGDLTLALDGAAWKTPENKVWTPSDDKKDITLDNENQKVLTAEAQPVGQAMLVLPQLLENGPQIVLNLTIKTYRDTGEGFKLVLTENKIDVKGNLWLRDLPQWGINQQITYTLAIAPTRGSGGSQPDPEDPDLKDAVITFDPAVADWQPVQVNAGLTL